MVTYPTCGITSAGIFQPTLDDVLSFYITAFRGIYGQDTYLGADSQDGQLVGLLSSVLDDVNTKTVLAYRSFSPTTAQSDALSSNVKLNGIARKIPSNSSVPVLLIGQYGTPIVNGVIEDEAMNSWSLPSPITIPYSGQVSTTATCLTPGAIAAPVGTIWTIVSQVPGWQDVTNLSDAALGLPVELDGELRQRQTVSTMLPSQIGIDGLVGALSALPNVVSVTPFENDTNLTDANGIPPKSTALVIDGGDAAQIANVLLLKKMDGSQFYGPIQVTANDINGISRKVGWFAPTDVPITYSVSIRPQDKFTLDDEAAIQLALANWTNSMGQGATISIARSYSPVNAVNTTFEIVSINIARDGAATSSNDINLAFYEAPTCASTNVTITLVTT